MRGNHAQFGRLFGRRLSSLPFCASGTSWKEMLDLLLGAYGHFSVTQVLIGTAMISCDDSSALANSVLISMIVRAL